MQHAQDNALFRQRHCRQRRWRQTCSNLGQSEIQDFRAGLGQHDVSRFQIAMDHAVAVRLIKRCGDLDGIRQYLVER